MSGRLAPFPRMLIFATPDGPEGGLTKHCVIEEFGGLTNAACSFAIRIQVPCKPPLFHVDAGKSSDKARFV